MRYWDAHGIDPRVKAGPLTYTFPKYLEGLLSKTYLISFWKSQSSQERRKIVGSIGTLKFLPLQNHRLSSMFTYEIPPTMIFFRLFF